jgi:hypothetical protein
LAYNLAITCCCCYVAGAHQSTDEAASPFFEENSAPFAEVLANMTEDEVLASAKKHALNGYTYCNLPGLNMTVGDR